MRAPAIIERWKPSKRGEKVKFDIESRQMSATGMNKGLELGNSQQRWRAVGKRKRRKSKESRVGERKKEGRREMKQFEMQKQIACIDR